MEPTEINNAIKYLTKGALSGASKTSLLREFKESYKYSDKETEWLLQLCNFKKKPKKIDYNYFYNNPITRKALQIKYPFTQLYAYKNFLTEKECSTLIDFVNETSFRSPLANDSDEYETSDYRTSQTSDLDHFHNEIVFDVDERIANLLELDVFLGEGSQAQKYHPGEYYKEHWDFFLPTEKKQYDVYCEWMGQRTWTTMIYLNDVKEGGETYFKRLNLRIKPERGLLIAWNNLYRNGKPNWKTMHEALPPLKENKYIITKWWRSWTLI